MSAVIDRRGSPLCVHPLERHLFEGGDFLCSVCRKPRALHYHDGFVPGHLPTTLSTDPRARYRGPHPRWTRPGQYIRPEPGDHDFHHRPRIKGKRLDPARDTISSPGESESAPKPATEQAQGEPTNNTTMLKTASAL